MRNPRSAILRAQAKSQGADLSGRHQRYSWTLRLFASVVSLGFVATFVMAVPNPVTSVSAANVPETVVERAQVQSLTVAEGFVNEISRDELKIKKIEPVIVAAPSVPAAGSPDPGTAQAVAQSMLSSRGMGADQYNCLVSLWDRESGWNVYAHNASSGAYGIPQSLPGSKMASAGADWATNPATQISWGLSYIQGRYGSPCGAWSHSENNGWY